MNNAFTVFYSWQSDLPSATNRGFIGAALDEAARAVAADPNVGIEPVIDRDTKGTFGAADIATTIFGKIERADLAVFDVSIVNATAVKAAAAQGAPSLRATPNANVLVELGYALRALGPERVIMVMNIAHGGPESLPFDLRGRKVCTYLQPEELPTGATRADGRRQLVKALGTILRDGYERSRRQGNPAEAMVEREVVPNLAFNILKAVIWREDRLSQGLSLTVHLLVTPRTPTRAVLPQHLCDLYVSWEDRKVPVGGKFFSAQDSNIDSQKQRLVVNGPGQFEIIGFGLSLGAGFAHAPTLELGIDFGLGGFDIVCRLKAQLVRGNDADALERWEYRHSNYPG